MLDYITISTLTLCSFDPLFIFNYVELLKMAEIGEIKKYLKNSLESTSIPFIIICCIGPKWQSITLEKQFLE